MGGVNDKLDFDIEYTWCWFLGLGVVIMKKNDVDGLDI